MKVALKPLSGVELKWRMIVINEIPNAPPTYLNIPRSPVIVATLSGISSIHALFEAGRAIPIPIPVNNIRTARLSATPKWGPGLFSNGSPWPPRRMVEREMMVKPDTIGHRYPHRLSKKLVTAEAEMTPRERGVSIIPLISVDNLCTEVA